MATIAQLSSDHQEIQTNISDVQCMDTQQSLQPYQDLQDNLTHQLETINPPVYSCGGTVGWRRVVHLDMADPHTTCPSGWNMTGYSKRTCGRVSTGRLTCDSATFPVSGGEYSRVCGRIRAYQWGAIYAFCNYHRGDVTNIDDAYACGVSVSHGTPRNHIWTFVAGETESNPTVHGLKSVHVIPLVPYVSLHLWGMTTSVSRESMSDGVWIDTLHSTPMTHYGMERTVSPAAHVAHNVILHILPTNCRPQPLMTSRPGSVCITVCGMPTLQWS